jgi:hypothetical protein
LRRFLIGQVDQDHAGTHELAVLIEQRRGVRHERHARTIRALTQHLDALHRPTLVQGYGQRVLVMRQ